MASILGSITGFSSAFAADTDTMRSPTTGKSLDILVEPEWSDGGQARFKVTFLKPGTDTVQIHIDYNVVVKDTDGKELFSTAQGGQALQHTAEGIVTIPQVPTPPLMFPGNGRYDIEVSISGINFVPMNTETATFSVSVTPEFPIGSVGIIMATLTGSILIVSRKFNIGVRI